MPRISDGRLSTKHRRFGGIYGWQGLVDFTDMETSVSAQIGIDGMTTWVTLIAVVANN
jgi:hypothetical protein